MELLVLTLVFLMSLRYTGAWSLPDNCRSKEPCRIFERRYGWNGGVMGLTKATNTNCICADDQCPTDWDETGERSINIFNNICKEYKSGYVVRQFVFCKPIHPTKRCTGTGYETIAAVYDHRSSIPPKIDRYLCRCAGSQSLLFPVGVHNFRNDPLMWRVYLMCVQHMEVCKPGQICHRKYQRDEMDSSLSHCRCPDRYQCRGRAAVRAGSYTYQRTCVGDSQMPGK